MIFLCVFDRFSALGIAGAAFATKGVLRNLVDFPSHLHRASPRLSISYPSGGYYHSQYYR